MYEPVLLTVNSQHEVIVCVSKDFLIDDGEIEGL